MIAEPGANLTHNARINGENVGVIEVVILRTFTAMDGDESSESSEASFNDQNEQEEPLLMGAMFDGKRVLKIPFAMF